MVDPLRPPWPNLPSLIVTTKSHKLDFCRSHIGFHHDIVTQLIIKKAGVTFFDFPLIESSSAGRGGRTHYQHHLQFKMTFKICSDNLLEAS